LKILAREFQNAGSRECILICMKQCRCRPEPDKPRTKASIEAAKGLYFKNNAVLALSGGAGAKS
jgi:hypothetical protein